MDKYSTIMIKLQLLNMRSALNAPGTETLKPLSLIHIGSWENSLFSLLALWGNKNGLPSMKVKKLEKFQNKIGLMACK